MYYPKYLYFIRYNGKYLYMLNGNPTMSTTPVPLVFTPDGWQEISIVTERNKKYFGLDRTFTIPLNFIKDGAILLKYLIYTFGQKAKAELVISEQKCSIDLIEETYAIYYDLLFVGNADFGTFNQVRGKASVNLIEGGLASLVKTFENTVQEIDISDGQDILMDGIDLIGKQNIAFVDGLEIDAQGLMTRRPFVAMSILNQDGRSPGFAFFNTIYENDGHNFFNYLTNSLNYFAIADKNNLGVVNLNVKGTIIVKLTNKRTYANFVLRILKSNDNNIGSPVYYTMAILDGAPYSSGHIFDTVNVDVTIPMNPGEKLFMYLVMDSVVTGPAQSAWEFMPGSNLSLNYINRFQSTPAKSLAPLELINRCVQKLSDGKYTAESDLLQTFDNIRVTSGVAIRQLENPTIKTSLLNFFNSFNTVLNIGWGVVDGVLRIEKKEYFFNTNTKALTHISNRSISANQELPFNSLKMGYKPVEVEEINGLNEFNNTSQWSVKVPEVQKEFAIISDYGAGCYEMESVRINFDGRDTTDSKSDNSVYMIHTQKGIVNSDGQYLIDRSLNAGATGIIEATKSSVFNIFLSPRRCFDRHGWYFHGCFFKMDTETIKFETADKNQLLVVDSVVENADVLIGNLPPALFIPFDIEIDTTNPPDYVPGASEGYDFTMDYVNLAGVAMKTGIQPATKKLQTFKLLALASNDMEQLIYSNE